MFNIKIIAHYEGGGIAEFKGYNRIPNGFLLDLEQEEKCIAYEVLRDGVKIGSWNR